MDGQLQLHDSVMPPPPAPLAARGRAVRECPRCESRSIARSRIRGYLGIFARRVLNLRPYRCLDCWHRFMAVSGDN
jgi:DNA-directed RNA polymerase subunit RPC12/RpoP